MTPWHPALVHFPVVLSLLVPPVILLIAIGIRAKLFPKTVWWVAVAFQSITFTSGIVAFQTGEDDERRMITNVPIALVHEHEEKASVFLWISGIGLATGIAGALLTGTARTVFLVLSLVLHTAGVVPVIQAGKTGGQLVYVHGAADVYVRENHVPNKD